MTAVATIDYIADWNGRLHDKVYEQFKDDPFINGFIDYVLAPQAQDLEDSLQTLRTLKSIDDSEGVQLDGIGQLVGQVRGGVDDETYRPYLRARVIANLSDGSPEALYAVMAAMFDTTAKGLYRYIAGRLASFVMVINTPITAAQAAVAIEFIRDAELAGVRGILEWQEQPDSVTFTLADATWLVAGIIGGATSIQVPDSAIFGVNAGSLVLDPGLASEETVTFTVLDPTHFTISATANAHSANAVAELVGDPGLGFPDDTWITTPALAGDGSIVVSAMPGSWPASGSILIDEGLTNEETWEFTKTDATHLALVGGTLAHPHLADAAVVLVGSGGSFENAVQA